MLTSCKLLEHYTLLELFSRDRSVVNENNNQNNKNFTEK